MDIIKREQLELAEEGEAFVTDSMLMSISLSNYFTFVARMTKFAAQNRDYKFQVQTDYTQDGVRGALIRWKKR